MKGNVQDKIKILYLIESLKSGGAEQLLFTTLKYLNRNKFSPVVYCLCEKGEIAADLEKETGTKVYSLNKSCRIWDLGTIIPLIRIFIKERPHILHTNLFLANYFGRIAALFAGIPVVVITEHGTYSNFKKFYHHWIDFILSFFTTKVIAVSNAVKKYLLKHSLILENKIIVIYNTIDFEKFDRVYDADKITLRKRLGFAGNGFIIGCVATLAPWKGHIFLLEAFSQVIKSYPEARLCLVGRDGCGFKKELESFARKKDILKNIYFLGERRDIPELLRAFDIFALPSLTEGLGISLLEAMYLGLPAVASGTEGVLEIIEDKKDGILSSSGSPYALATKIESLLKDRNKSEQLGFNAREKVRKYFSTHAYIQKLESLYEGLAKK